MVQLVKNLPANAEDMRCGFSLWRRQCQPTQYSFLENSMDSGAWQAAVHNVTKSGI